MTKKIGILGGGQLARMMCLKGFEMGLEMHVLSPSKEDPAAQVTQFWSKGKLDNSKHLKAFLNKVDVATFESEFLDGNQLHLLQTECKTKIFPSPKTMELLQDRLSQKLLLEKSNLNTSPFLTINNYSDLENSFNSLTEEYELFQGLVLKKRKFGYDGYGTFVIKNKKDLQKLKPVFKKTHPGFIAELFVPFNRELAFTVCRNKKKEFRFLPLVETHQVNSRCLWVKGPVETDALYSLQKQVKEFLNKLNYIGVISFELFDVDGSLLINEVAPRVHNSAHYSLDALVTDQFSYALRCLVNAPLPSIESISSGFAMYNLLGTKDGKKIKINLNPSVKLHWYGKKENRKGRKMGHITTVEDSPEVALRYLKKSLEDFAL